MVKRKSLTCEERIQYFLPKFSKCSQYSYPDILTVDAIAHTTTYQDNQLPRTIELPIEERSSKENK